MATTVYTDIPARVYVMKKGFLTLVATKAYRRIMNEAESVMAAGGAVEVDIRIRERDGEQRQSGDVQEWISAKIDRVASAEAPRDAASAA